MFGSSAAPITPSRLAASPCSTSDSSSRLLATRAGVEAAAWGSGSGSVSAVRHPELKVSTPAHKKHLGWYLEFEFRVTPAGDNSRLWFSMKRLTILLPAGQTSVARSTGVWRRRSK